MTVNIRLIVSLVVFCGFVACLQAQVVFLPLTENQKLFEHQSEIGVRDYPTDKRVVLMAGDSQEVCISFPDFGFFDSIADLSCQMLQDVEYTIVGNCVNIKSSTAAAVSQQDICLVYVNDEGDQRNYRISVDIVEPLRLPFFDDFSATERYPDPTKWVDRDVYVNRHFGFEPPSVGVATFDGLNSNGTPYGGSFGRADYLTSNFIDLSNYSSNDQLFLSFYLQPKGLTHIHQLRDSIVVEFKDADGNWKRATSYPGMDPLKPATHIDPFEHHVLGITSEYRHRGFQFRFVNYSYRLGVFSTWHLDYVRVMANQIPGTILNDIALVSNPNPLFKTYSAMPFKQVKGFAESEVTNETRIDLFNHFEDPEDIFNTRLQVENAETGELIIDRDLVNTVPQLNPPKGLSHFVNAFDGSPLVSWLNSQNPATLPIILKTTYQYEQDQEGPFGPENNNIVSGLTEVGEVLAYDDGTAEVNIAAEANNSIKSQIAVKFHLNTGDTLRAVQMHFPRLFNDVSNQLFNLKVWVGSLDKDPDYFYQLRRPIYPDALFDTLQAFTTFQLVNDLTGEPTPLYIPAGDFYIGWQQFSINSNGQFIPVGFDRNYKGGEELTYYKSDGDWKKLSDLSSSPLLKGIPMIRAVFRNMWTTSETNQPVMESMAIYPNPTNGIVHFDLNDFSDARRYMVINASGNIVMSGQISAQIDLSHLPTATYMIIVQDQTGRSIGYNRVILLP